MAFQKGHKLGKGAKGRSGRKTKAEEIKIAVEKELEEITNHELAKLARSKVYKAIEKSKTFKEIKEMALPVALKDMTEKFEGDVKFRNKTKDDLAKEIADEVANLLK